MASNGADPKATPRKKAMPAFAIPDGNATLTTEEKQEVRKKLIDSKEVAPSTRHQSAQGIQWKEAADLLGTSFDPTAIPLSKLYQMRRDPMLQFALHFVKVPLVRAQWFIECSDAQVAAFVDGALRRIYARLIFQLTLDMDFGYSAIVKRFAFDRPDWKYYDKNAVAPAAPMGPPDPMSGMPPMPPPMPGATEQLVWDEGPIDAIVWKPFVALPPESVEPMWKDPDGDFDGIRYDGEHYGGFLNMRKYDESSWKADTEHSLWSTNERDSCFGSIWGFPRLGYAYRFWWSYWYNYALADRYFEKHADPPPQVYFPGEEEEVIDDNGNTVNYKQMAFEIGENVRSGGTIALPSTVVQGFDERPTTLREWEVSFLQPPSNFEAFGARFEYLDIMKLRAMMVPEQAFVEGKGGTSSRNVASTLGDTFQESQAVKMDEITDIINRVLIPQIVAANFPERQVEARFKSRGFQQEDMELSKQLIQLVGQQDAALLEVDVREMLNQFGIPMKTPEEIAEEQRNLQAQIAASTPPPMEAIPGDQAGIAPVEDIPGAVSSGSNNPQGVQTPGVPSASVTGFSTQTMYYQAPERIDLGEGVPQESRDTLRKLNLSVQYDETVPGPAPGAPAYFDRTNKRLHMIRGLSQEQKRSIISTMAAALDG